MARVVVIFAILSLITGAMFWLARHPSSGMHTDAAITTVPVAPVPAAKPTADTTAAHTDVPSVAETAPAASDALPPAEANAAGVTLNATGAEANVLQQQTTTASPAAQTGLVVETVEAGRNNSLSLKGRADPGATVRVSVNGKPAGEVTVGGGGSWSVSVDKGKGEAEPNIALVLVGADGKVIDKTNFVYKTVSVPPLAPQDQALINQHTTEPAAKPAKPPRSQHASFRVRDGESLWRIARRKLGSGDKWRELYEANKDAIGGDPDFVRAGTRLVLPS